LLVRLAKLPFLALELGKLIVNGAHEMLARRTHYASWFEHGSRLPTPP
jgi:hypothetical protein